MTIICRAAEFLEIGNASGHYLYSDVSDSEFKKVKSWIARGWEGRAWRLLRTKVVEKQ